ADAMAQRNGLGPAVLTEESGRTTVGGMHADEHFDRRSLAGPIVAEKGVNRPLRNFQVEAIHYGLAAVAFDQPADGDHAAHVRSSRPRRLPRPFNFAHSSSTRPMTSSAVSAPAAASRTASRRRARMISRRRASHRAGASAVTSIPRPRLVSRMP